jgi:excisionase family DNA binding protein
MSARTDDDGLLTLGEAAEMLRISISTAKKLASSGALPGVLPKVGRQWRISRAGLVAYIHGEGHVKRSTSHNGDTDAST